MFNAYQEWLGIPFNEQPPNHFRLLWLDHDVADTQEIEAAALRQRKLISSYADGAHGEVAKRVLEEIDVARSVLLDPGQRAAYRVSLSRARLDLPPGDSRSQDAEADQQSLEDILSAPSSTNPFADGEESRDPLAVPQEKEGAGAKTKRRRKPRADSAFAKVVEGAATNARKARRQGSPTTAVFFIFLNICLAMGFLFFVFPRLTRPSARSTAPPRVAARDQVGHPKPTLSSQSPEDRAQPIDESVSEEEPDATDDPPPSKPVSNVESREREWTPDEDDEQEREDEPVAQPQPRTVATSAKPRRGAKEKASPEQVEPPSEDGLREHEGKDVVFLGGEPLSLIEFREKCHHVDLSNFCDVGPKEPVSIEAVVVQNDDKRLTLALWYPGEKSPMIAEVSPDPSLDRIHRKLKEGSGVLAYGWFTDAAPGGRFELKEDLQDDIHQPAGRTAAEDKAEVRRRTFYVAALPKNASMANTKNLEVSIEQMTLPVGPNAPFQRAVSVTNRGKDLFMSVSIDTVMYFGDNARNVVQERTIFFGRIPPGQTIVKPVTFVNRKLSAFIPRFAAKVGHAIRE